MSTAMLQFRHRGGPPTPEEVCALFDLSPGELDTEFGVIATDPEDDLYTVLVDAAAASRVEAALAGREPDPAEGFFANPPVDPFDSPEG